MNIKISGRIKTIFPLETVGNGFTKRVVWIEELDVEYPNTYQVEFLGQKRVEVDAFDEGDMVDITADVRGRYVAKNGKEWVFNSLSGWKIARQQPAAQTANRKPPAQQQMKAPPMDEDSDDLPF